MSDAYYYDALHHVLRNRLNLQRASEFDGFERRFVTQRIAEGVPAGNFDLAHLQAIHRQIFQDLYEWAGVLRVDDVEDGEAHYQAAAKIAGDVAAIHRDLGAKKFLADLEPGDFAREAALLMGDLAFVRPFFEGNNRALLLYLKQLALKAGHPLDLTKLPAEPWIEASASALGGDIEPMAGLLTFALS